MPTASTTSPAKSLLSLRGISKRFGSVQALATVDLDFDGGEIHAVLGENGAGKSTLMNILNGVYSPDAGRVSLAGARVAFTSPRDARAAGIGMVHQHFTLVDALSVAENLALSVSAASPFWVDARGITERAAALAAHVGLELSPMHAIVGRLPVGARQRIEILKALAGAQRVLILDEPTAVLTPQEVHALFTMLRRLRAEGRLVIFITHKLREVKEVADRVTILRRGHVVETTAVSTISEAEMAERMVGDIGLIEAIPKHATAGAVRLSADQLRTRPERHSVALRGVTFEVRAGEIFGVAGVDGNGQDELFQTLVGLTVPTHGTVQLNGTLLPRFTPQAALTAGIGHIPPDRQREGLVLAMSVQENFLLSRVLIDRFRRRGLVRWQAAGEFAAAAARCYALSYAGLDAPVRSLSGGNQQRLIIARTLAEEPAVLVAVNPTRGLDVAAARVVAGALITAATGGCAVVLISTDLDEVISLSDRLAVLFRGRLSAPLAPPFDPEQLGLLMAGA